MVRRTFWLLLVLATLWPASAWTQDTTVSGSITIRAGAGGDADITFACKGEPTCVGTHQALFRDPGCSNALPVTAPIRITGLDLSRSGPITVLATIGNLDFQDVFNPDGTCSIKPGSVADTTLGIGGTWDGSRGALHLEFDNYFDPLTGPRVNFHVVIDMAFTASRPAPPPPVFPMTVTGSVTAQSANIQAQLQYRPQDAGTNPDIYVFAYAPATKVGKRTAKDSSVPCVLAQLGAGGTLAEATVATLQKSLDAIVSSQGATVNVLNNVATPNVAGATFYVGYGSSPSAMIGGGLNRSAVTVPGDVLCKPQPPQTGWWWNPKEDGRGFSVEVHGNNVFFAGFLYDASGRSTWYVATGPTSLDGSLYIGPLYGARGGQSLGGAYPGSPTLTEVGTVTLAFNSDSQGTMIWPGGIVPLQRFDIVAGGGADIPAEDHPESGWWWNPQESGRGFFMEWQRGTLDMAGYMYDEQGNSVWYLAWNAMAPNAATFSGNWWSFADGQTLTGAWKPNRRVNDNVAPVTVTFTSRTTAVMTLPNGRTTALQRHRF